MSVLVIISVVYGWVCIIFYGRKLLRKRKERQS